MFKLLFRKSERRTDLQEPCVEDPVPTPEVPVRAIFPADYRSRRSYGTSAIPISGEDGVLPRGEGGSGGEGGPSLGRDADRLVVVGSDFLHITADDLRKASYVKLGRGESVYKCVLESKFLALTLKNLLTVKLSVPEFRDRIDRVKPMDHPNLLPVIAYCYDQVDKFILYEYAPSGSLFDLLHGDRRHLTIGHRLEIALGVAEGLAYFHTRGISHGNIKSSNILVTTGLRVLVLAFGLPLTSHRFTAYRAPEVTDPYEVSQEADVYSFGVLIIEILTRRNPNLLIPEGSKRVDLLAWMKLMVYQFGNADFLDVRPAPYIENGVEQKQIIRLVKVAAQCLAHDPSLRLTMSAVRMQIMQLKLELC